jgi:rhodanese-related sulfurtransferase
MSNDAATATSSEEISPQDAWQMLQEDPRAQLVDVRTEPEWLYVGDAGARRGGETRAAGVVADLPEDDRE